MGKRWDGTGVAFEPETWAEMLRVLKPGGSLVAFGGTRTHHRLMCAIEDAGFEIRDTLMWLYGQGFPKSLDISKAIDKAAGAENVVGTKPDRWTGKGTSLNFATERGADGVQDHRARDCAARAWEGYGTALKPAWEPIIWAMKPCEGTFAGNAERHGVAGINIEAGRVEWRGTEDAAAAAVGYAQSMAAGRTAAPTSLPTCYDKPPYEPEKMAGRWPANAILDEVAGAMVDEQSGRLAAGGHPAVRNTSGYAGGLDQGKTPHGAVRMDAGGASRFFYCAKASRGERNRGLEGMPAVERESQGRRIVTEIDRKDGRGRVPVNARLQPSANHHPTVKPVALMRYLVRLFSTPSGGIVLDPFAGSGSTGVACVLEGREFLGFEQDREYCRIARGRIRAAGKVKVEVKVEGGRKRTKLEARS